MLGSQLDVISLVLAFIPRIFWTARSPTPTKARSNVETTEMIFARTENLLNIGNLEDRRAYGPEKQEHCVDKSR